MPKITEKRRQERRNQYLDAARRCISRNGIHGTRMEDVTNEAGLSAGSMYLYFETKDDLVRGAIESSLRDLESAVAALVERDAAAGPSHFVGALLAQLELFGRAADDIDLFRLAIQGWAFAQTDAVAARLIRDSHARLHAALTIAARRWEHDPRSPAASHVADALVIQLVGFVVQRALIDDGGASAHLAGATALARALAAG